MEYAAALARIHARRRRAHDDHPDALSTDPREVLAYLRKRGRNGLIADATGDDVTDALTLRLWLWWEGEATELWLLEAAEALGRRRKDVGAVLGLTAGQSLVDRIRRTQRLFDREPVSASPVQATTRDGETREIAAALIARRDEMPDEIGDDFYADQLAAALPGWTAGDPPPTAGVLNALRFLLGDLVDVVPAGTPLRELVDRGVELVGTRSVENTRSAVAD